MSPFARGLLGGVAEGVTETAGMLFADAISQKKEERLQAIREKEYARARTDQLADYQMARTDQLADTASQREFERGLLTEQRAYDTEVRNTEFGQQVALQTLGVNAQKALLDYGQKFPQSTIGKLIADRDKFEPGDEQYEIYNRQIQQSQIISNTNQITGAISLGIPIFEDGKLTGVKEVATFGGIAGLGSPSSSDGSEGGGSGGSPGINDLGAPAVQNAIDQIESALNSGNYRGATRPQLESRLQELRRRLERLNSQAANPGFGAFQEGFAGRMKP
tara:strand:- start:2114 stop:2944 length:831 start_codon:yes stop_codon:yes gene_type:complete